MIRQRPARQHTLDDEFAEEEEPAPGAGGSFASRVAAIIENRAKEIGIAFYDRDEATLHLTQFAGIIIPLACSSLLQSD